MKSEHEGKSYVTELREIRDQINAEIADMSYEELSRWLKEGVRSDPLFAGIPKARKPGRPRAGADAVRGYGATRG